MFEHKSEALLSTAAFYARVARGFGLTLLIVVFSLLLGGMGYHYSGNLSWIDALLNAAMILTGMGPVDPMRSTSGKVFAIFYALYSGVAFLSMVAVLTAPVFHRFLHRFHLEADERE